CRFFADGDSFRFLGGLHISQIIDKAELLEMNPGDEIVVRDEQYAYYVLSGSPLIMTKSGSQSNFLKHELIGNMFSNDNIMLDRIVATDEAKLFKINLNDVFDVLTNYKVQANRIINTASKNLQNHFYQNTKH
ncbi:hypothetical protein MNBD_BACTEROID06-1327, partial [hydrothermal vent metagenome]